MPLNWYAPSASVRIKASSVESFSDKSITTAFLTGLPELPSVNFPDNCTVWADNEFSDARKKKNKVVNKVKSFIKFISVGLDCNLVKAGLNLVNYSLLKL